MYRFIQVDLFFYLPGAQGFDGLLEVKFSRAVKRRPACGGTSSFYDAFDFLFSLMWTFYVENILLPYIVLYAEPHAVHQQFDKF